jgi:hypothetical protein
VLVLVSTMVVILLVAGLVVAYVAYPHRRRQMPAASWLGEALRRGADALPTLGDGDLDPVEDDRPAPSGRVRR